MELLCDFPSNFCVLIVPIPTDDYTLVYFFICITQIFVLRLFSLQQKAKVFLVGLQWVHSEYVMRVVSAVARNLKKRFHLFCQRTLYFF